MRALPLTKQQAASPRRKTSVPHVRWARRLPVAARLDAPHVYNVRPVHHANRQDMEAEQINTIDNRLADLGQRTTELRRYL